jgi:hypothetical protein
MKYKLIPFNMTLAQRISDGSVRGRVIADSDDPFDFMGESDVKNLCQTENGYMFTVGDEHYTCDKHGKFQTPFSKHGYLQIGIPVENSRDDDYCNANSGIKEMQELQKDLQKDGHYHKCKIEPIEYILANNLGFCEGNVVKYITRYKDKGGVDDLRKIKIYVDYLIDELTNKD